MSYWLHIFREGEPAAAEDHVLSVLRAQEWLTAEPPRNARAATRFAFGGGDLELFCEHSEKWLQSGPESHGTPDELPLPHIVAALDWTLADATPVMERLLALAGELDMSLSSDHPITRGNVADESARYEYYRQVVSHGGFTQEDVLRDEQGGYDVSTPVLPPEIEELWIEAFLLRSEPRFDEALHAVMYGYPRDTFMNVCAAVVVLARPFLVKRVVFYAAGIEAVRKELANLPAASEIPADPSAEVVAALWRTEELAHDELFHTALDCLYREHPDEEEAKDSILTLLNPEYAIRDGELPRLQRAASLVAATIDELQERLY